jgi:DNA polymerase elongation subunit (family B)
VIFIPQISISAIEYDNSDNGPVIHVYGRDEIGEVRRVDVHKFSPYFYVPFDSPAFRDPLPREIVKKDEEIYKFIGGGQCVRLHTKNPSDVRYVREKFGDYYEADEIGRAHV